MKVSEQWLRDWVDVDASIDAIGDRLTMAGLEVDGRERALPNLDGVVIGKVESCQPHPDADRLSVCEVDVGDHRLQIVCGAPNVAQGVRVPVATVGAQLPAGLRIKSAKLRGVASNGMLCSAEELGLDISTGGLWLLPDDAPVGASLSDYLHAGDTVLEIDLTPNRGDCLSMRGVAREVAVAYGTDFSEREVTPSPVTESVTPSIRIEANDLCSTYAGRCVLGIDSGSPSPIWMRERLRRAGVRVLHPAVDVGNYVMLDLGQPMHAFDADKLVGGILVRRAAVGESIVTLDGQHVDLQAGTLVIADEAGPVAVAGMIGGQRTAVDENTCNVLFESANFTPAAVAGQGRKYKIHTDALHRYERGVDPALPVVALEQASALLTGIAGGRCGPVCMAEGNPVWAGDRAIELRGAQVARLLGQSFPADFIENALRGLGATCEPVGDNLWHVTPPSWRYDLAIEADLVEEIARLYGYDRLTTEVVGTTLPQAHEQGNFPEGGAPEEILRQRGYNEAITYSFVDPALHAELTGNAEAVILDNPISEQMVEMRRTLWAGLLGSWHYNARRQQSRIRLFEQGLRFVPDPAAEHGVRQIDTVAGLAAGTDRPHHWDISRRTVDFFDIRGDIEALMAGTGKRLTFQADAHPALHPGRSARIDVDGHPAGWIGQLAPAFNKRFKGQELPYLFELDRSVLSQSAHIRYQAPSDQPQITRDLALVVSDHVAAGKLIETVEELGNELIRSVSVFDVFRGDEVGKGFKSIALSLIFQDKTSTLSDEVVDCAIATVTDALAARCGAKIRG